MRGIDKEVWIALIAKMPEIINAIGVLIAAVAGTIGAYFAARVHTIQKQGNATTALGVAVSTINGEKLDALAETVAKTAAEVESGRASAP